LLDVLPAIKQNSPLPVLACALIHIADDAVRVIGTDLQTQITSGSVENEDTALLIDAHKLSSVLKLLPGEDIKLDVKEGFVTVASGRSRYKFATLDAASFPQFDHSAMVGTADTDCSDFRAALASVATAMGKTDVRSYLNGVNFISSVNDIELQGSDGHRVAIDQVQVTANGEFHGILPREAVLQLLKTLPKDGGLQIVARSNTMDFHTSGMSLSTKLIEGRYPDVQRIIPRAYEAECVAESAVLSKAVERAMLATNDAQGVVVEFAASVIMVKAANNGEESEEVVDVTEAEGTVRSGYNGQYIIDALSKADKEVRLQWSDSGSLAITSGATYFTLIMPMRM
jgi:DNA polymerase-3 subunit beta